MHAHVDGLRGADGGAVVGQQHDGQVDVSTAHRFDRHGGGRLTGRRYGQRNVLNSLQSRRAGQQAHHDGGVLIQGRGDAYRQVGLGGDQIDRSRRYGRELGGHGRTALASRVRHDRASFRV